MITNPNRTSASSRVRAVLCLGLFIAASVAVFAAIGSSHATGQRSRNTVFNRKIAPWVIEHIANGQHTEFFVVLADQADLSGAAALRTKTEKGRYVHDALLNKNLTTQGSILQWLRERGIEHRSFYIVNAILVKGSREIAEAFAARPDVARVEGNPVIHNALPQPDAVIEAPPQPQQPATIEPGIQYTHAPDVWALGFRGQGSTVAGADTGQRWTHNALKPHYRGWNGVTADHNYNWHDSIHNSVGNPCGNDSPSPCDDNGHGTHTTGTAIGDDGIGNQIGMAPGAKWIGCRNMDQGNGTPASYLECMEWFLAPYPIGGGQGDPLRAPDITSNSWTCPPSQGCSVATLQAAVEAQTAAGIMMVVNAGSQGPACSTVQDPPAIYAAAYSVGALNTGTDNVASFSSRGPVIIDGSNRIKPDITAPGTNIRSSYNTSDNAYVFFSGTSIATPHIAGAMALLWCARPELRHNISSTRTAMDDGAHFIAYKQCGTPGPPNNVAGWGRVDALAALGPGCTPGWSGGPNLPSAAVRLVGVYFTANGLFYGMGGLGSTGEFMHPFEYNPGTNTWTTKSAFYPDNQVNNMACGVLYEGTTNYIYCVGGSGGGAATATDRVFRYNPVTDTIETLTSQDNWPGDASGTILPGGFAVVNNKLYILGGFNINVASTNQIWQFDPTAAVGSKWTQMVNTPVGVMYAPTCAINDIIYLAGASDYSGGTVIDTTNSFSFNPATNAIGSIVPIPRATGETRALNFNGKMLVMGGGRVAPNPSNEVDIFDPTTGMWTTGSPVPAFMPARRNFATDTNGISHIWLAGGNAPITATDSMEIFCAAGPTTTPTATPTATATLTPTPTATMTSSSTPTATPIITPSPTPTATATPRPTPTPRPGITPRGRPTPPPRPAAPGR